MNKEALLLDYDKVQPQYNGYYMHYILCRKIPTPGTDEYYGVLQMIKYLVQNGNFDIEMLSSFK